MKASSLEIYGLSVCFVAAFALAIALYVALCTLVQLSNPLFALGKWDYQRHLSNDAYWESESSRKPDESRRSRPEEEVLTREREASFATLLQTERHEAAHGLLKVGLFIFVDVFLFIAHWLIARSAHG